MRAWLTIDRWGPGVVALLTLLSVIAVGWIYGERIARLEGQVQGLEREIESHAQVRAELNAVRNWSIAVYERGSSAGWKLPEVPKTIISQDKEKP